MSFLLLTLQGFMALPSAQVTATALLHERSLNFLLSDFEKFAAIRCEASNPLILIENFIDLFTLS